jgi:putative nucleotidyltransferase with HDIG domain
MGYAFLKSALFEQEKRATIFFLRLFFLTVLAYDVIFRYLMPSIVGTLASGYAAPFLGIANYAVLTGLLVLSLVKLRGDKFSSIKYIVFITYLAYDLFNDLVSSLVYSRPIGNASFMEILLLLFSPIFVNHRFFWSISLATVIRYLIVWAATGITDNAIAIATVLVFLIVPYLLLKRFCEYVKSIETTYDEHLEGVVRGIVSTIELKDPYTRGHSERVAFYASILAKRLNVFSDEQLRSFHNACLLHDIGKVNIPDDILLKPTSLSPEEYEIIKSHTTSGAEAVRTIKGLEDCVDVILCHHERWDGEGYPFHFQAEEIPLMARVVTLADSYDAMTTHRSYRPAYTPQEAYQRIIAEKGSQFDPKLVEALQEVFPEWEAHQQTLQLDGHPDDLPLKI